jgi:nitroreductase
MLLPLTPDELLTTTHSVRKRLDFSRPVELEIVRECLALALQAPNGGNGQRWRWVTCTAGAMSSTGMHRAAPRYYQRRRRLRASGSARNGSIVGRSACYS